MADLKTHTKNIIFQVSEEDVPWIEYHKCYIDNKGRILLWAADKLYFLHRIITQAPKGMDVDHINHDILDNRRENLRVCTHQYNACNRKAAIGVYRQKKKWAARMKLHGKQKHIGTFDCWGQALKARQQFVKELLNG